MNSLPEQETAPSSVQLNAAIIFSFGGKVFVYLKNLEITC